MKRTAFSPHEGIYIQHLKTSQKHNMPVQHYHDAYEIYLQLDGKRYLFYDNVCYILERGDIVIFKPFDIHYAESREVDYYERYVLNFQESVLKSILNESELNLLLKKITGGVIHLSEEQTADICGYFYRIEECSRQNGFFSQKLLHTSVFQLIVKVLVYEDNNSEVKGKQIDPDIIKALKYINYHYKENISLDDIAETVHMSKFYFCRKFHSTTGATVLEYLNNVRLTKVHNLLLSTKMGIDEIATATGFSSAVSLTRNFKKVYGKSPRDFRKENNGAVDL